MFKKHDKSEVCEWRNVPDSIWTQIKIVQSLVGVTQADYRSLYVATIENVATYLTAPNQKFDENDLIQAIEKTILALKKRQGYLLPMGADSEIIFREREEWTFAVFSASLLNVIDSNIRALLAKALIPSAAYAWLHRNQPLFSLWQDYLNDRLQDNIFAELISSETSSALNESLTGFDKVNAQINSVVIEEEMRQAVTDTPPKQVTSKTDEDNGASTSVESSTLSESSIIKTVDLFALEAKDRKKVAPDLAHSIPVDTAPVMSNALLPEFTAQDLWQWLRWELNHNSLTLNQKDSIVHRIDRGLFVVIPHAIDAFLLAKAHESHIQNYHIDGNQRINLTKGMKKHTELIRNAQGSRIHSFCLGKWQDRQLLSGLVMDIQSFLGNYSSQLAINTELIPDPMVNDLTNF